MRHMSSCNMVLLSLHCFVINACIHNLIFQYVPILQKHEELHECPVSSLTIAQEGSCEPHLRSPPEFPRDCKCCSISVYSVWVPTRRIQTYCTKFIDDLTSNELLKLSCECASVRDEVNSIRIHDCNMALTVNFACADQSCVGMCFFLPCEVTPYPYSVVPCTHRPPWSKMRLPEAVV